MKNKYRFWDKQEKKMISWEDAKLSMFSDDRYIPLQCIGIKDKNGNFIYDGDLLLSMGEDDEITEVVWNAEKARFGLMIQWTDPCYWNGLYDEVKTGRDYYDFDDFYIEEFDVIGNIYESVVYD